MNNNPQVLINVHDKLGDQLSDLSELKHVAQVEQAILDVMALIENIQGKTADDYN